MKHSKNRVDSLEDDDDDLYIDHVDVCVFEMLLFVQIHVGLV
jgi:hypothetical protein